jgi:hypothetical protein
MKIIIFLVLLISSNLSWSEEIKVSCNINLTHQHSNGATEKNNINEILEITISKKYKSIIPMTESIASISSRKDDNTIFIDDFSDDNKIDLTTHRNVINSTINDVKTSIRIDRNTGKIFYSRENNFKDGSQLIASGNGSCEKVNVSKKKF